MPQQTWCPFISSNSRDHSLVEEVAILFREVRFGLLDSESEAEIRSVPNVDEAVSPLDPAGAFVGRTAIDELACYRRARGTFELPTTRPGWVCSRRRSTSEDSPL
jgi:hypothetical protein